MIEHGIIFGKGLAVGFALAMIVGPIGIFCIQQTLRKGFKGGFAAGLGAATADAVYGTIAGFGLTFVADFLMHYQTILQLAGGIFLLYLGVHTFTHKVHATHITVERANLPGLFTTTFFLTLANPVTILAFTALLASIKIEVECCNIPEIVTLFTSVFLGSTLWWLILTGSVSTFRSKISMSWIQKLNKIAGVAIALFGVLILLRIGLRFL